MLSCVFAGSFDPMTVGHMDVITRASSIFDQVTVAVMVNVSKKEFIPADIRIRMLQNACSQLSNVRIDRWDGLLAEYMRVHREKVLIRGVRNGQEFDHEYNSALMNHMINDQFETLLLPSDPSLSAVSSSAVREILHFGGDVSQLVPSVCLKEICEYVSNEFRK